MSKKPQKPKPPHQEQTLQDMVIKFNTMKNSKIE